MLHLSSYCNISVDYCVRPIGTSFIELHLMTNVAYVTLSLEAIQHGRIVVARVYGMKSNTAP